MKLTNIIVAICLAVAGYVYADNTCECFTSTTISDLVESAVISFGTSVISNALQSAISSPISAGGTEYPQPFINSLSVSFSDCTPTLVTATSGTATVTTVQSFFGYPLPTPTPMVSPVVEDSGGYLVVYLSASEPTPCGCVQQLLTGSTFAVCTDTSTSAIPSSSLAALIPTIPVEGGPAYIPPALQEPGIIPVIVPHINF